MITGILVKATSDTTGGDLRAVSKPFGCSGCSSYRMGIEKYVGSDVMFPYDFPNAIRKHAKMCAMAALLFGAAQGLSKFNAGDLCH